MGNGCVVCGRHQDREREREREEVKDAKKIHKRHFLLPMTLITISE
jgi:hypothetical protein